MNNFVFIFVIAFCGTYTSYINGEENNRIINGWNSTDYHLPYMASLQRLNESNHYTRGHRCGGALVTLRHVVTAASCLYDSVNGVYAQINPNDYRVFAGSASLINDASANRTRRISNFIVNPNYIPGTSLVNDIAIIRLVEEFPGDEFAGTGFPDDVAIKPVRPGTTDAPVGLQDACRSSGWGGQNETSSVSTNLQYVVKTVFPHETCVRIFESNTTETPVQIRNSMVCAISIRNSASCAGDIGNPLVCGEELHGVLILAPGCPMNPSAEVYTRITSFRSWINSVTSGVSTFQPEMAVLAVITVAQIITINVLK